MRATTDSGQWPVVGHEWAVQLLQSGLAAGRQPHAVLFTGPAQIGKRSLALAFAAAINCASQEARPCGQCRSCRKIDHGTHPDVRVVQADVGDGSREGLLKIDQIRELQRSAALAPIESPFKVYVLREIERANLPAANALLKTLEEPPSQVILLLTSVHPHAVLPTIRSRCQVMALRPLSLDHIARALVDRWGAAQEEAELLSRLSEGRLGWAVHWLHDRAARDERSRRLADITHLPRQGRVQRLNYAETLARTPAAIHSTLEVWTMWWRDLLLVQQGCAGYVSNVDRMTDLEQQAQSLDPKHVRRYLARLQEAPTLINQNANARLVLETLVLHMPEESCAPS